MDIVVIPNGRSWSRRNKMPRSIWWRSVRRRRRRTRMGRPVGWPVLFLLDPGTLAVEMESAVPIKISLVIKVLLFVLFLPANPFIIFRNFFILSRRHYSNTPPLTLCAIVDSNRSRFIPFLAETRMALNNPWRLLKASTSSQLYNHGC